MKNSLLITKYVIDILQSNETLAGLMDTANIYPIDAKQGTNFPFAVINRTGILPARSKDGSYTETVDFIISVVDDSYKGSVVLANEIRRALEGQSFKDEETTLHRIRLSQAYESFYSNAFIQQLNFQVDVQ